MNKLFLSSLIAASVSLASGATLSFNVSGVGPGQGGTVSGGAGAGVTSVYSTTGIDGLASSTFTITLSNLDLDGVGAADDTASFTFGIAATGGSPNEIDDNGSQWGVSGNGAGRLNGPETLTFSFDGSSITLGNGSTYTGLVEFIGFNGIDFNQFTNDGSAPDDSASLAFGGGLPSATLTDASNTFGADSGDMTIGVASADSPNDGFKVQSLRVRFGLEQIPEPSSSMLVALSGLSLVLRRRR